MRAKHTPGPWHLSSFITSCGGTIRTSPAVRLNFEKTDGACVAVVKHIPNSDASDSMCAANSLLIAAAPDLLAACQAAAHAWAGRGDMSEAIDSVLLAIAKATAET